MKRALFLALALSTSAPATADAVPDTRKAIVAFDDLDLSRSSDLLALAARIDRAAERVCRSLEGGKTVENRRAYRACWVAAMRQAARDIGDDRLSALVDQAIDPAGRGGARRQYALD